MSQGKEATKIAEALGLRTAKKERRRCKNGHSCEDCFFHQKLLCALDLDEPCSTFRPYSTTGLVPPRQPSLLVREAAAPIAAAD